MWSNPAPVAWIRGRFIDIPLTQELLEDAGVQSAEEWNDQVLDDEAATAQDAAPRPAVGRCRVCGCTDDDCSGCIERTGEPCSWWVELPPHPDGPICSACAIDQVIQGTSSLVPRGILYPPRQPTFLERLRERFRIAGWIFRLLRR